MANVINTREQVKLLQSQGLTPKQIIQQFPEGTILHAQVEGILGIDCEEIDRDLDNLFDAQEVIKGFEENNNHGYWSKKETQ